MDLERNRFQRADLWLLLGALVAGVLFVASLHRIWPLADLDVNASRAQLVPQARAVLHANGIEVGGYASASALRVDGFVLDYLIRSFGITGTQRRIREGDPIYFYTVEFRKRGNPDAAWVELHPRRGAVGWGRTLQDDAAGGSLGVEAARRLATGAMTAGPISPAAMAFVEKGHTERERPRRTDHGFVYERTLSRAADLRERVSVTVSGNEVTAVSRQLIPPESARRAARAREAPVAALQMTSFLLLGLFGLAALVVFLKSLERGDVRMGRAAGWVALVAVFFVVTQALQSFDLLLEWDPLWPRWIASFQTIGFSLAQGAWIAFALFVVLAAGDALDRRDGGGRGDAFWRAGRGRLLDTDVGLASLRGFLTGLVCGGVLVAMLLVLERVAGAWVSIQPQGFFFFAINSEWPAVSTLLYFFIVATVEEMGYRFFAGTWLLSLTGRKWIAILIPAILYGASHTGLGFLPPTEPFWGRAVALTAVGCVWGWAFLRYDALTVVLSHFTADLFVFNWPRLGSGDRVLMAQAIATMSVPLVPALLLLIPKRNRGRTGEGAGSGPLLAD